MANKYKIKAEIERYSFKRKEWTLRDDLGRFAGRLEDAK